MVTSPTRLYVEWIFGSVEQYVKLQYWFWFLVGYRTTIHNNNEEEEEEEDDNNYNDNDNDYDSPRQSLPNCTHNDLDVASRKRNQTPIRNEIGGEVATLQAIEHLASPTNFEFESSQ